MEKKHFLGNVKHEFIPLWPNRSMVKKFTTIPVQASEDPNMNILDISSYEGLIIIVEGDDDGDWVYSSRVLEKAGPVLSNILLKVFK